MFSLRLFNSTGGLTIRRPLHDEMDVLVKEAIFPELYRIMFALDFQRVFIILKKLGRFFRYELWKDGGDWVSVKFDGLFG